MCWSVCLFRTETDQPEQRRRNGIKRLSESIIVHLSEARSAGTVGLWTALIAGSLLSTAGCSGLRSRSDSAVEVRLREMRQENDDLRRELQTAQSVLQDARRELIAMREQTASESGVTLTSGTATGQIARLEVNPLLSGGLDRDQQPGDELLSVLVTTLDADGSARQEPGTLTVTAYDYALNDAGQQVGQWKWDPEAAAERWVDGLVGAGYRLTEPWMHPPRSREIVLHVRFVSLDGRQFDATETVLIDVPQESGAAQPVP